MLPLLIDEDVDLDIIRGLALLEPDLDYVDVRDIGLKEAPDPVVLSRAVAAGRVVVTSDASTMTHYAASDLDASAACRAGLANAL